ncbi:MAG: hypothetical protein ACP5MM_00465 [Acidithiobacillus sp.]|jgi:Flp pilus assembly protein TadB|uniref:hypothetical protein n=1 Tax=Acidithiobacillus sp. TaxID=1872118 RepID=UPI003CFCF3FA
MKIIYALVVIGALAVIAALAWWGREEEGTAANDQSVRWYQAHPDALAAENLKCWKLVREASFADVDQVMAAHPHCKIVYRAIEMQDREGGQ